MIVVDRIEGSRAVLEVDGELVELPSCALPDGSTEGSRLQLSLAPTDDASTDPPDAGLKRLASRHDLPDDIEL